MQGLRVGEPTLGDHLRRLGVRPAIVGKTHMVPDLAGMDWLGIDPESHIGVTIAECGFEPFERDDGMHPYGPYSPNPRYDDFLRTSERALRVTDTGECPWHVREDEEKCFCAVAP